MEKKKAYRRLESDTDVKNFMAMYYLNSKNPYLSDEGIKLAWVTSGAPVEYLIAADVIPLYPENYGAIAGAAKDSTRLCIAAENCGYSSDLCSYARTSFGSILSPDPPTPLSEIDGTGGLAKPDMLICGNNICGTVLKWYQDVSRIYDIPMFLFDTPPLRSDYIPPHYRSYVEEQLVEYIQFIEMVTKNTIPPENIDNALHASFKSIELWSEILEKGKISPAPLNCADRFLAMAPIVCQRGSSEIIPLYETLLEEVNTRIDQGLGAITGEEKYRLLWDNIPIWFNIYSFFNTLASRGAVFPVDTYTNAWGGSLKKSAIDYNDHIKTMAQIYSSIYLNQTLQSKIDLIGSLAVDFNCTGVIYHSQRSCKRYSLGQPITKKEVLEKTGIPGILIDGDMTDSRNFSEEQTWTRIEALLEIIDQT